MERENMKKVITGIMLALMAMTVVAFVPNFAGADASQTQTQGEWVRMMGNIVNWTMTNGTITSTYGWVVANAAIVTVNSTVKEWATANALWSDILRAYPMGVHPLGDCNVSATVLGNFSYTFSYYTARLLSVSELSFNKTVTGHDFYLAGYWNASEVTETINITWSDSWNEPWSQYCGMITVTCTETPVAIDETGTLVADWGVVSTPGTDMPVPGPIGVGTFGLNITSVGTLSGFAFRSFIWARELNMCDFNGQGKVDISDLVMVAQHYGQAPGFAGYDPSLDVCGEGQIGIGDLATVAANIQG
jgi:hypothetical protein